MSDNPPRLAIVDVGLAAGSLTSALCRVASRRAVESGLMCTDLSVEKSRVLPFGEEGSSGAVILSQALAAAEGVLIAFPVYNFNMNASLKSLIEHCSRDLGGKVVGIMATAGGRFGYMSMLSVIQTLMLDVRCWIVPRQVYAVSEDFRDGSIVSADVERRVYELVDCVATATWRMRQTPPSWEK
ncbi:MAG: NADPH-dependent FMN reductase [Candidatus Latescibacterota bacterium]|nr:NADPH-dependent FMN reductase [Candidatus Latescibacterota bacterium]